MILFILFFSYLVSQDEMQISRMPIPADDCTNSEMSVDTNPSDTKSDSETITKVNGDSHKKLNGSAVDDPKEADEASEVIIEEEIKKEEINSENKTESSESIVDEPLKNGTSKEQESEENVEEIVKEESIAENDTPKDSDRSEDNDALKDNEDKDKGEKDEEKKETPMEIDETEDQKNENVIVSKEHEKVEEPEVTEHVEIKETEKLKNGKVDNSDEVVTKNEEEKNPVNGEVKLVDEEKSSKSEKICQKVPEEEDMSSEMSTDTLSPKQVKIY